MIMLTCVVYTEQTSKIKYSSRNDYDKCTRYQQFFKSNNNCVNDRDIGNSCQVSQTKDVSQFGHSDFGSLTQIANERTPLNMVINSRYNSVSNPSSTASPVESGTQSKVMQIVGLTKSYTSNKMSRLVLSNISSNLELGKVYTLVGSNGAGTKIIVPSCLNYFFIIISGKSTFLKILSGLDSIFSGEITILQPNVQWTRMIGWCPQSDPVFDFLTVQEHLDYYGSLLDLTQSRHSCKASWCDSKYQIKLLNCLDMFIHRQKLGNFISYLRWQLFYEILSF